MQAHYGYEDGSGPYYITIDTDKCNGCEECVKVCPAQVLEMDEEDPLEERRVATVAHAHRRRLKESCALCKPNGHAAPPCVTACEPAAIEHSW